MDRRELIVKSARLTSKKISCMNISTIEEEEAMWDFIENEENKVCLTPIEHTIWKVSFIFS